MEKKQMLLDNKNKLIGEFYQNNKLSLIQSFENELKNDYDYSDFERKDLEEDYSDLKKDFPYSIIDFLQHDYFSNKNNKEILKKFYNEKFWQEIIINENSLPANDSIRVLCMFEDCDNEDGLKEYQFIKSKIFKLRYCKLCSKEYSLLDDYFENSFLDDFIKSLSNFVKDDFIEIINNFCKS